MTAFVSEESFARGLKLETMLTNAPKSLGILFASVTPSPVSGGKCYRFSIVVGISRAKLRETVLPIIETMLVKEKEDGSYFAVEVVRGTSGVWTHEVVP